ncbi:uncharacterized protein C1orf122 homolog isoform 2-T2 [Morphnus guianensis]
MEAAGEPHGRPADLRRLRSLLEARQRHLRARIAACEQLTAEMAALQAALGADGRPPCVSAGPGPGPGPAPARRGEASSAPRPPVPPCSPTRPAPGLAAGSPVPGGGGPRSPEEPRRGTAAGLPGNGWRSSSPRGPRSEPAAPEGTEGFHSVTGSVVPVSDRENRRPISP